MSVVWVLVICTGVSWGGCGHRNTGIFPDAQSCYEALGHVKMEKSGSLATGKGTGDSAYAACLPQQKTTATPTREGEG